MTGASKRAKDPLTERGDTGNSAAQRARDGSLLPRSVSGGSYVHNAPITMTYKLPVYPGWRMWLWRIFRIKRPLWNVYEFTDVMFGEISENGSVDFRVTGESRLIHEHVNAAVAGVSYLDERDEG